MRMITRDVKITKYRRGITIALELMLALMFVLVLALAGCGRADGAAWRHQSGDSASDDPPPYAGVDARGIPHYARREFTAAERELLLRVYGVEDPNQLYVSDSTDAGLLEYDSRVKTCTSCYVNSYLVGFVSMRRPGESWDALERRVRSMRPADFPPSARVTTTATAAMDPDIRDDVERMLADARTAGFRLRIIGTYRSPEREALLMAQGKGRTYTLTSMHSYGRAIDLVVGDGNIRRRATRDAWIAFRRWVVAYDKGEFRLLGTPERTWDWPHVEIPTPNVGFRSIDDALARARACSASPRAGTPCDFPPHLPPGMQGTGVQ